MLNFKPDLQIDLNWLHRISGSLQKFSRISSVSHTYNSVCPFCDPRKKKDKKFYFYTKKHNLNVICHRCGYSSSFYNFIKDNYQVMFDEYKNEQILAVFETKRRGDYNVKKDNEKITSEGLWVENIKGLVSCIDLPDDHDANKFLSSRMLTQFKNKFFFTDNFKLLCEQVCYNLETVHHLREEPRLVIPFFTKTGKLKTIQGRSFIKDDKMKYITIKTHEDSDKIYGLESIDDKKIVYCVEGPIDSLFVDNCLATCDSNLTRAKADVYIWDNEPRNKDIVKQINKAVENGKQVVIWPTSPNSKIDINDLMIKGLSQKDLMKIIEMNTFKGIEALAKLNKWRKV